MNSYIVFLVSFVEVEEKIINPNVGEEAIDMDNSVTDNFLDIS